MKKVIFFLFVALMLGSQGVFADSYQRWVVWVNEPGHIASASEMADIFAGLSQGKILPNKLYQVGQTTFKITYPESYFAYLKKCIQVSDPSITTVAEMINAIKNGEKVQWGNDLHMKTKNYWINSSGEVVFTENYSGAELGVWVLLINGKPTIKLDCGNPLEVYPEPQQITEKTDVGSGNTASIKKSVYLIDTVHKTVYVYDTLVYSTTIYDDQYYYGNGSSYTYYAYAEPVWYFVWWSWPIFRYDNYYSFRKDNCCCNFCTDFSRYEINYNYNTYYGRRTELPSGRGYALPVNSGQGYDPNLPNGRELPPPSGGARIDPPSGVGSAGRGQGPGTYKMARNTTRSFVQPSSVRTGRTASTIQRSSSQATTQRGFASQQGRSLNGGNVQRQLFQTNQTQQRNFNNSRVGRSGLESSRSAQRQPPSSQQGFQRSSGGSRNSTATYSTPQRQSFSGGGATRSSGGASRSTGRIR